ncbi:hypothetical protein Plec18167_008794 [Paecilomyces lecythidis]|uniref:Uncharacterized protein n=1 Tax=Paecilomyces lecythidis TaxID=3004212 RepID=A0ABR3WTJ9_9EURO
MSQSLDDEFGRLAFSLESTDEDDVYTIVTYPEFLMPALYHPDHGYAEKVHFTRPVDDTTELPSRILLQTHAAIAKIYHASGMAESIEKVLKNDKELRQLAGDGSTDLEQILPVLIAI